MEPEKTKFCHVVCGDSRDIKNIKGTQMSTKLFKPTETMSNLVRLKRPTVFNRKSSLTYTTAKQNEDNKQEPNSRIDF